MATSRTSAAGTVAAETGAAAGESQDHAAALPQDFESALAELETLVASMEDGTLPLEASLAAYRRGVALSRLCQDKLAQAEQQVKVLEGELLKPLDTAPFNEDTGT